MIKINQLKKKYKSFALECSLEVKTGSVTALIGKNGAGKSTTFKALLGLVKADGGKVEIFGKDIKKFQNEDWQKIGVAMADSGFSGYLTITDVVHILKNMYKDFVPEQFLTQCKNMQLPLTKQIRTFSTGMQAKFKILVALCHKAELLILDEPTLGLDVVAREEILDLLRSYMEENEKNTILISSHISSDLENLCDDFYIIQDGNIVFHEDVDALLSEYGILKCNEKQYEALDKNYVFRIKKEKYGYSCLTAQRQFYMENYPELVMEKGNLDELILMMIGGNKE